VFTGRTENVGTKPPEGMTYDHRSISLKDVVPYICRQCHLEYVDDDVCPHCNAERDYDGSAVMSNERVVTINHGYIAVASVYGELITRIDSSHIDAFECRGGVIVLELLDDGWPITLRPLDPEDAQRLYWHLRRLAHWQYRRRNSEDSGRHIFAESKDVDSSNLFGCAAWLIVGMMIVVLWEIGEPRISEDARSRADLIFVLMLLILPFVAFALASRMLQPRIRRRRLSRIANDNRRGLSDNQRGSDLRRKQSRWYRIPYRRSRSRSGYPADWDSLRRAVYRRDGYQCANCGAKGVELHAHHIVPLSVGGTNSESNIVTLCRDCHKSLHPHMRG